MPRVDSITFFDPDRTNVTALHGVLPELDGRGLYNVVPRSARIELTDDSDSCCSWDAAHAVATVTHGLSCLPEVLVYTAEGERAMPDVSAPDEDTAVLDFGAPVEIGAEPWTVLAMCAGGHGAAGGTTADALNGYMEVALAVRDAIERYNADENAY